MLNKSNIPLLGLIGIAALVWTATKGSVPRNAPPPTTLEHFDGVLDHSGQTYDGVLSRLSVDAAHALEAGDAKKAEELYREIVRRYPTDPEAHENLGVCLGYQKRFAESREQYLKALELNPHSADAYRGLGNGAYEQDRDEEALGYLLKSLELKNHGLTHWTLALIYDHQGEATKAKTHFDAAIKSNQITHQSKQYAEDRVQALK